MSKKTVQQPNLQRLLNVALPMIVSQAAETFMMFADRYFLSSLGKNYISAAMSGGLSFFVFNSFFIGIVGYVNALSGQYFGSGEKQRCLHATTQGIYLSFIFSPFLLMMIPLVRQTFVIAGHTAALIELESIYFSLLALGGIFLLLRVTLASFFLGIGETRIVMIANITGMVINIPLNYILIFGKLGLPAMGIHGAAIGTIGGSFAIALILLIAYTRHTIYRKFRKQVTWSIRKDIAGKLLKFGLPAGAEMFFNTFAFNVFLLLMHSISEDVAAAVTITFNYDMIAFIPMLGLGIAVTALVAQQMGADSIEGAKKAVSLSLKTGYTYAFIMMCLFILGAGPLVSVFSSGLGPGDEDLLRLARWMLRLASIYTLADVTQLVFAGALRGAGDTRWVMFISAFLHWAMAIGALILIKVFNASPLLVWCFFIGFVVTLGVTIMFRYFTGKWQTIDMIGKKKDGTHTQADHLHIQDY